MTRTLILSILLCLVSCSKEGEPQSAEATWNEDSEINPGNSLGMPSNLPVPPNCGDGILTDDEACDDGNRESDDGCTATCLAVEAGFSCNPPGKPCKPIARCGDGMLRLPELCDDGNTDDGDGCSFACRVEMGYQCEGNPSACTPTECGDGEVTGTESCDDGNRIPFDGCSASCLKEPDCASGGCVSECGDGIMLDEECDDGNNVDGDGCASDCTVEAGFTCAAEMPCEMVDGKCVLRVSAVFRDFRTTTDPAGDFEGGGDMVVGLVDSTLSDGKPVLSTNGPSQCPAIKSAASFDRWYTDGDDSETLVSSLLLFNDGNGAYVNRWGSNGEQWCVGGTCYDGTPVFFPVDDLPGDGDVREATIPPEYSGQWLAESEFVSDATPHNFGFTSEVMYWFRYDDTQYATLSFLGDDDLWVFINGRLALDLGCVHMPEEASVTLDSAKAMELGLEAGSVYPIKVFHAERNPTGSSFKLTLAGFDTSRSLCLPECGDGKVGLGEECDDGDNDGGYGECHPGCKLGAFCGDGIVQDNEDCDDGNTVDGDSCGSACRMLRID